MEDPRNGINLMISYKSLVHDILPSNTWTMEFLWQMLELNPRASLGQAMNYPDLFRNFTKITRFIRGSYEIVRAYRQTLDEFKSLHSDDLFPL